MIVMNIVVVLFLTIETIKDLRTQTLDLWELIFFLAVGFLLRMFWIQDSAWKVIPGMFVGILMLIISFLSGEAIGYGDGMVVLVTGVLSGIKMTLVTVCIAFFVMSLLAAGLLLKNGFNYKENVPFVPCILIGFLGGMLL